MTSLPLDMLLASIPQETTVSGEVSEFRQAIDPGEPAPKHEQITNGLIADLAWILLLGAVVTLLFKKLKQPVVLGYILEIGRAHV